jgi:hypothetical protein
MEGSLGTNIGLNKPIWLKVNKHIVTTTTVPVSLKAKCTKNRNSSFLYHPQDHYFRKIWIYVFEAQKPSESGNDNYLHLYFLYDKPGSAKAYGREPETCLGRVFNYKLGCFEDVLETRVCGRTPTLIVESSAKVLSR